MSEQHLSKANQATRFNRFGNRNEYVWIPKRNTDPKSRQASQEKKNDRQNSPTLDWPLAGRIVTAEGQVVTRVQTVSGYDRVVSYYVRVMNF